MSPFHSQPIAVAYFTTQLIDTYTVTNYTSSIDMEILVRQVHIHPKLFHQEVSYLDNDKRGREQNGKEDK